MSQVENPHAGQGTVVLDIGGDVGALVVSMPTALVGSEIEISPHGARAAQPDDGAGWWRGEWRSHGHGHDHAPAWPHVGVLARPTAHGPKPSAVFPALRAGRYDLWLRPDGDLVTAVVTGGGVTMLTWPDPGAPPRPAA